jgi:hypothetical protein
MLQQRDSGVEIDVIPAAQDERIPGLIPGPPKSFEPPMADWIGLRDLLGESNGVHGAMLPAGEPVRDSAEPYRLRGFLLILASDAAASRSPIS